MSAADLDHQPLLLQICPKRKPAPLSAGWATGPWGPPLPHGLARYHRRTSGLVRLMGEGSFPAASRLIPWKLISNLVLQKPKPVPLAPCCLGLGPVHGLGSGLGR
jgi:hypothetical protein